MKPYIWVLFIDEDNENPLFYTSESTDELEKQLIDYVKGNYEEDMEEPIPVGEGDDYIRDRYFCHIDEKTWRIEPAIRLDHPQHKGA